MFTSSGQTDFQVPGNTPEASKQASKQAFTSTATDCELVWNLLVQTKIPFHQHQQRNKWKEWKERTRQEGRERSRESWLFCLFCFDCLLFCFDCWLFLNGLAQFNFVLDDDGGSLLFYWMNCCLCGCGWCSLCGFRYVLRLSFTFHA